MNKALWVIFIAFSFSNLVPMHRFDRCGVWRNAMILVCKNKAFDPNLLAAAEKEAMYNQCRRTDIVASEEFKSLFEQAGATAQCPDVDTTTSQDDHYCLYIKSFNFKGN